MENKHKLLATESSQALGVCPVTLRDRFTALPDEIALHILSSLCFRDLTRVGAVSKKCYEFYLLTPSICFDAYETLKIQLKKMNCFDRFLHRRGNNKMIRFGIDIYFSKSLSRKVPQVMTWINTALSCRVEVLDLRLDILSEENRVGLPSSIFSCGSLKSLSVKMKEILKVPSSSCPNNLQSLNLTYVTLGEGFPNWISSSCKCIKEINLNRVKAENVTIESSSLESFTFVVDFDLSSIKISGEKLKNIHIKWTIHIPGSRSLNIYAPNLKYLKWTGNLPSHPKLGELLCLERAELFLEAWSNSTVCEFNNIFELLRSICRVKTLILSDRTIMALFSEGSMAAPIFDTSYLRIMTPNLNNALVPAIVSLMRGMSNLKTLDIKCDPSLYFLKPKSTSNLFRHLPLLHACGFNGNYWKSQNLDFVNQLEEVTIDLSNGNNSWQLARFILEHAQNLKKMSIFYLPTKEHVINKVSNSKKVSSATIDFQERQCG